MTDEATPGAGTVQIELGDKVHDLVPTYESWLTISDLGGGNGLNAVAGRIVSQDARTIIAVICAGIGATSGAQQKEVQKLVFEAGTIKVSSKCLDYITVLQNGGQMPQGDDSPDDPLGIASQSGITIED